VFAGGRLVHVDAIAIGGGHVTMDVARGLSVSLADAERLKTLYGACVASPSDERDSIAVQRVGDEIDQPTHLPRSELVRIIRPRVEEILELARDRLQAAGHAAQAGRRLVLTGGACQLTGLPELARAIVSSQARIGRPLGVEGLPESAKNPAFAAAVGLMVYPQMAGVEHFEPRRSRPAPGVDDDGYVARVGRWLRESF
jgi:cell division protein FtsA